MPQADRYYVAIDLKSFYASVEYIERGLNPLLTNLVVADASRPRLFEVVQKVREANAMRRHFPGHVLRALKK